MRCKDDESYEQGMTDNPHLKYWKPAAYVPPEYKATIQEHAAAQQMSVSSWLTAYIECELNVNFAMRKQNAHGKGRRKK